MKLITTKVVKMLGDLIEPNMQMFVTATTELVHLSLHYGGVIEFLYPPNSEPFQSRPLPTMRVEFENATERMPIHQFGLN